MSGRRRILFVTSNGTGLGHLTRSMAIARRLDSAIEPFFITFSAGAPVVRDQGFPVEYIASYDRPGAGTDLSWTLRARDRLRVMVGEIAPELVVFDGTHPYERLLPALRSSGAPLVWCRRAMWRADADTAPLHRSHLFDAVLEPGELDPAADRGPTAVRRSEVHAVDPIVLLDRGELVPRDEAERELGLDPARPHVLVALGQGEGVREASALCLRHLAASGEVQVAALRSHLAGFDVPDGVLELEATYPIGRYFAGFDAAVSAAGYNAFHEVTAARIPALFVPIPRQTDDQVARAAGAAASGVGLAVDGPRDPELERRLDDLLDGAVRERLRAGAAAIGEWRGAEQAASWLGGFASTRAQRKQSAPPPSAAVRARRAWIFASTVPRTLARVVAQRLRRPRMRVLVTALGIGSDPGAIERAISGAGERPERIVVITDRLEFAALLRAGVGFEHVPAPGERQAELASGSYEAFRDRRVELIRARRSRPKRVVDARGEPPAPVS